MNFWVYHLTLVASCSVSPSSTMLKLDDPRNSPNSEQVKLDWKFVESSHISRRSSKMDSY